MHNTIGIIIFLQNMQTNGNFIDLINLCIAFCIEKSSTRFFHNLRTATNVFLKGHDKHLLSNSID